MTGNCVFHDTPLYPVMQLSITSKNIPHGQTPGCMIKIFRGGRGGDTFKTPSPYEQLLPLPTPCFKMFLERSLNDPLPPHFKHLALLPPPHPPPLPP